MKEETRGRKGYIWFGAEGGYDYFLLEGYGCGGGILPTLSSSSSSSSNALHTYQFARGS